MFEHKKEKLLPLPRFGMRVLLFFGVAALLVFTALAIGIIGYHGIAKLTWLDALLNAAMILTGMGPVNPMTTPASKLFASAYALFSGVVFLSSVGVLFSPVLHRLLHRFHLETSED
jgi:hypothetical protein